MYGCLGSLIYMQTVLFALYATATVQIFFWTFRESFSFHIYLILAAPTRLLCTAINCTAMSPLPAFACLFVACIVCIRH